MGRGVMAQLVREYEWISTPLGPIEHWSETLLSHVNLLLCTPLPATLSWGEQLTFFYNDAAIPTLGERHPKALGWGYRDVFADAWHLVGPDMEGCFYRGETPVRENVQVPLLRDGKVEDGYYTYALVPVYEGGKIVGVYDPYQNTTQVVLSERERVTQEERLQLALSAANGVGIWDWDIAGDLVYTDTDFARMYGVDPVDGARGISLAAFTASMHKDDVERVNREISNAVRTGSDFASEYRVVQRDGSIRWVFAKGHCYHDAQGKPLRFPGVTIDITERVAMEDALRRGEAEIRRNEEKFRIFVEAVSDVVYRVNADWSEALEVAGRGFLPDTHAPDPEWFTRNVHPEDQARVRAAILHAIREGSVFQLEHKVQRLDGTTGWTFSRAIPVRDQQGRVVEWLGAASDITARKQAEHALLSAEKLAAVGRLASSIAHEINNPLEAVTNLIYLAEQTADLETKHLLELAQQELQRVSHITTNTLQFNRQRALPGPINVVDTMQSVLDLYQGRFKQAGIQVVFEKHACPLLSALGGEIRQLLANLVGNALDAIKPGGTLKIRVRPTTDWGTGRSCVRITVADNGHGMSPQTKAQVYKPFFTTKESTGTGLGLWISADIVERHNGSIRLRSTESGRFAGTTFSLVFPQDGAPPTHPR
jgi:PAS domain S-box-containing protein